jgi:hypothetical protein
MRPQIVRLRADIASFQEVNGQERPDQPRSLLALAELLAGTNLAGAQLASTRTTSNEVYDERNLVVATTFPVFNVEQLRNDLVDPISYRRLTANPPDATAVTISIERPILHVQLDLPNGTRLHVINVHLKSKIPTDIPGQKIDNYTWRSADAWAEGSFVSSMKRMSQALDVLQRARVAQQSLEERDHWVLFARENLVDLRGGETSSVGQVLRRFEPDASWHGRIADEALDHLDGLVCGQEHPLGCPAAHLGC